MKKVLALVLTAVMALSLVACGSSSSAPTGAPAPAAEKKEETKTAVVAETKSAEVEEEKPINIVYMTSSSDLATDMVGVCYNEWVKTHSNVNMELQTVASDEINQKTLAMANTNTLPNVYWANSGILNKVFDNTEASYDLSQIISDDLYSVLAPGALDMLTSKQGAIMGYPVYMTAQGFANNKALYAKYGLEVPETWDDLVEAVKVLHANDVVTIGVGSADTSATWGYIFWSQLLGYMDQAQAVFGDNSIKYADADFTQYFDKLAELAELGAFPENNSAINYDQTLAMFLDSQCATITISSGKLSKLVGTDIEDDVVFNWGITFPDSKYDQNIAIKMASNGYGVGVNTDDATLKAISDLMEYRFTPEGVELGLSTGRCVPVVLSEDDIAGMTLGNVARQQLNALGDDRRAVLTTYYYLEDIWEGFDGVDEFEKAQSDYLMWGLIDGSFTKDDLKPQKDKINDRIVEINAQLKK